MSSRLNNPYRQQREQWGMAGRIVSSLSPDRLPEEQRAEGLSGSLLDHLLRDAFANGLRRGIEDAEAKARAELPPEKAGAWEEGVAAARDVVISNLATVRYRLTEIEDAPKSTIASDRRRVGAIRQLIDSLVSDLSQEQRS